MSKFYLLKKCCSCLTFTYPAWHIISHSPPVVKVSTIPFTIVKKPSVHLIVTIVLTGYLPVADLGFDFGKGHTFFRKEIFSKAEPLKAIQIGETFQDRNTHPTDCLQALDENQVACEAFFLGQKISGGGGRLNPKKCHN